MYIIDKCSTPELSVNSENWCDFSWYVVVEIHVALRINAGSFTWIKISEEGVKNQWWKENRAMHIWKQP